MKSAIAIILLSVALGRAEALSCFGGSCTTGDDDYDVESMRNEQVSEDLMRQAYTEIDGKFAPDSDIASTFDQINKLIAEELRPSSNGVLGRVLAGKKGSRSRLVKSMDKDVVVNALIRLLDLANVTNGYKCTCTNTRLLELNNQLASDPVDQEDVNTNLGKFVAEIAARRADHCLPVYRNELLILTLQPAEDEKWLYKFLDSVLIRRFKRASLMPEDSTDSVDKMIQKRPVEVSKMVAQFENGIEADEVDLAEDIFDEAEASTERSFVGSSESLPFQFDKIIVTPCKHYLASIVKVFYPMDFDLKSRDKISGRAQFYVDLYEADKLFGKHRAYQKMCQLLVNEHERFAKLTATNK